MAVARTSLATAVRDALANPVSRFPRASHQPERITGFARPTFVPSFAMQPGQRVFTIGSCFARNVEEHLAAAGFDVPPLSFTVPDGEWQGGRPNGILNKYTPTAIRTELEMTLADDVDLDRRCLADAGEGSVIDLQLPATRSVSLARGLERRRQVRELFAGAFDADVVVITLGQVETWWDAEAELYTNLFPPAAVHRHHPGRFFFESLDYDRCLAEVCTTVQLLLGRGPSKRILLTVSPVPLGRTFSGGDALMAYLGSKSLLRTVAGSVTAQFDDVDYLPAFEAVMLTERSAAFDDHLHVFDALVGDVVGRAVAAYTATASPSVA